MMTSVLKTFRVIEAANFVSGPYVGQLLADLGRDSTSRHRVEAGGVAGCGLAVLSLVHARPTEAKCLISGT